MALQKLTGESSMMKADFRTQVAAVEKTLNAKKARVKRLERDVVAEAEKRPLLLIKRRETSETASCHLAEDGESLQESQSKIATVTAVLREWRKLATETVEKLKVAKADVVLQSGLSKTAWEDMDDQPAELAKLKEQLAATDAKLSQLSAKHGVLKEE